MEEKKPKVTSPTESTESKVGIVGPIPKPHNIIEKVINLLRSK